MGQDEVRLILSVSERIWYGGARSGDVEYDVTW